MFRILLVHLAAQGNEQHQRNDEIAGAVEQIIRDAVYPAPHSVSQSTDEHIH